MNRRDTQTNEEVVQTTMTSRREVRTNEGIMRHTQTNGERSMTSQSTDANTVQANERTIREDQNETEKRFYDEETGTFDATNLKSGDIPFRKRVTLPEYSGTVEEAKLTLCREKLNEALRKYKEGEQ